MCADVPIQAELFGLIWKIERRGILNRTVRDKVWGKSFSLPLLCRVVDYPIKVLISCSREKGKLCSLHLKTWLPGVFEMSLSPKVFLPGWKAETRSSQVIHAVPSGQGTGYCWVGDWTELLLQCFTPWERKDVSVLAFCFSIFMVSRW